MPGCALVVDDDPAFRELAVRMLTEIGFETVVEAESVQAGLAQASSHRPDSALVDMGLPDGDGISLARELVALPWHPRVVLTSTDAELSAAEVTASGAAAFIPKADLPDGNLRQLLATP
jgi:two-component system nitrate/nitrite response regulator NarL